MHEPHKIVQILELSRHGCHLANRLLLLLSHIRGVLGWLTPIDIGQYLGK